MEPKRCAEILAAGFKAAQEQMAQYPNRMEYPHSYRRLYDWLEEKVYDVYEAIELKRYEDIHKASGEVIVYASEIVELTKPRLEYPVEPERIEEE